MSVRPSICGFDLEQFRRSFGSGDEAVIAACSVPLDEIADDVADDEPEEAEDYRREAHAILRRAVMDGVPFPDLGDESGAHLDVAMALAESQEHLFDTGSGDWKMDAFWKFEKDYRDRIDPQSGTLLGFLTGGRPLFGERMTPDGLYAYLDSDELGRLLAGLRDLQRRCPELNGKGYLGGFADTLVGWLDAIAGRGQDLWLGAS